MFTIYTVSSDIKKKIYTMPAGFVFVPCLYHGTISDCFSIAERGFFLAETERVYCAVRKESGYIGLC